LVGRVISEGASQDDVSVGKQALAVPGSRSLCTVVQIEPDIMVIRTDQGFATPRSQVGKDRERATEGRHVCCGMKFAALLSDGAAASSKFLLHVSDTAPSHRRRSFWGRLQRSDCKDFSVRSAYPSKSTRNVHKQQSQQREIGVTRMDCQRTPASTEPEVSGC
jgi:hypothetical protein